MKTPTFSPGFRCSVLDVIVLIAGAAGSIGMIPYDRRIAFIIGFTVAHFFLFCNVFRLSRPLELMWATIFVALCFGSFRWEQPPWPLLVGISIAITCIVIIWEICKPSYHGIGWRQLNPRLPEWWERKSGALRNEEATARSTSG